MWEQERHKAAISDGHNVNKASTATRAGKVARVFGSTVRLAGSTAVTFEVALIAATSIAPPAPGLVLAFAVPLGSCAYPMYASIKTGIAITIVFVFIVKFWFAQHDASAFSVLSNDILVKDYPSSTWP